MRLSSHANRRSGFTLVEVLVAGTASALILGCLCGVYFAIARSWQRQQGQAEALVATSQACSRLSDYISQSVGAIVYSRFSTGDSLAVNLPADTLSSNLYAPIWSDGKLQYRSGQWIGFYLSDSTGNYNRTGDILWAATVKLNVYPVIITPDRTWSMYYNQNRGRTAPLRSIRFTLTEDGSRKQVTMKIVSAYKIGNTEAQISQTRTTCLRNSE